MSPRRLALAVLAAAAFSACGSDDATEPSSSVSTGAAPSADDLATRRYLSTKVVRDGVDVQLVDGGRIALAFSPGSITFVAGCNTMNARYEIEGSRLTTSAIGGTEIDCPDDLATQDEWIVEFFSANPTITLGADGVLTLTTDDAEIDLADREDVVANLPLTETRWVLESVMESGTAKRFTLSETPTLQLLPDGTTQFTTACNSGTAPYEVLGTTVEFGPAATTRRGCADDDSAEVERAILRILDSSPEFVTDDRTLTLGNTDGGLVYTNAHPTPSP